VFCDVRQWLEDSGEMSNQSEQMFGVAELRVAGCKGPTHHKRKHTVLQSGSSVYHTRVARPVRNMSVSSSPTAMLLTADIIS
jgi:hypothetical protein